MPPTHQEIAELAGVSRPLVTRALHRSQGARINPETRQEIIEVARQLGYRPRNFTTHNVGYVGRLDALALVGENRLLLLTDRALRRAGLRLLLRSLDDEESPNLAEVLNPKTVDGVIFTRWFDGRIRDALSPEIPWIVMADDDAIPPDVDKVTMDTAITAERVVEHLLDHGHQRLGIVTNPSSGNVTSHLHTGVRNALARAGLPPKVASIEVRHDAEIAGRLKTLMQSSEAPTAFIAFGAEKAVTVLNLLNTFGYQVPRDVSLISLLDSNLLEPLHPAITATTALGSEIADRAVERLFEKIEDVSSVPRHILVPGELVHRQSVARAKK